MRVLKFAGGFIKCSSIDGVECEYWNGKWQVYVYFGGGKQMKIFDVRSEVEGRRKINKLMEILCSYENKGSNIIVWEEL